MQCSVTLENFELYNFINRHPKFVWLAREKSPKAWKHPWAGETKRISIRVSKNIVYG